MTITINGTTGIAGVDGSAATPSVQGADTNTGMFFPSADVVGIATGGTERMRVDSSGIITGTAGNLMLVSGTAVASTSGTSIDFTGIPSWVKRITVMFSGVSTSGISLPIIQIGAGSIDATGYNGATSLVYGTNSTVIQYLTTGAGIYINNAVDARNGSMTIGLLGSNTWVFSGIFSASAATGGCSQTASAKTLSGTLDRVRITTVNGTDTFDAGSINIMYE